MLTCRWQWYSTDIFYKKHFYIQFIWSSRASSKFLRRSRACWKIMKICKHCWKMDWFYFKWYKYINIFGHLICPWFENLFRNGEDYGTKLLHKHKCNSAELLSSWRNHHKNGYLILYCYITRSLYANSWLIKMTKLQQQIFLSLKESFSSMRFLCF